MDAKVEMKEVRDWMRKQRRLIDRDPYLADVRGKLTFRIVRWDKRYHSVLIVVRDESQPETPYNSGSTTWLRLNTWSDFRKWELWKAINDMCCRIRHPDRY